MLANAAELKSLYETADLDTGLDALHADAKLAAVTASEAGSYTIGPDGIEHVPPVGVVSVVDATGAGDLYAAGFLFGLAKGASHRRCAELGSLAAGEILTHIGARPQHSLHDLAEQQGLLG